MLLFIAVLLVVSFILLLIVRDVLIVRRLPSLDSTLHPHNTPFVTIIIPMRNEAENVARCLDGVLNQQYGAYEVIVVDDGSTDATPRILADYAAHNTGRLRVVPGRPLPRGWVGKCNACLHGAHHARGVWLLFLDADTTPRPTLLTALMAFVQQRQLDAVSALPFNELRTWPERLVLPVFFQFALTAFPLQKMLSTESPPDNTMANGQCLIVKSSEYWALGGHEAVKDKVLEDIEFAQAFRRAGYRLGIATAFGQLRARMYHNLGEIVQGLGKHAAAGRRASGWRAFWAVLRLSCTLIMPPLLWLVCFMQTVTQPSGLLNWSALFAATMGYGASLTFWAARYRNWYGLSEWTALLAPIGWLIYLFIVLLGTFQVLFKRGVVWKERVYP